MSCLRELVKESPLDSSDTRALLKHLVEEVLQWPSSALITRDLEALPESFINTWQSYCQRRLEGEPVAYILGYRDFYDIRLKVSPAVLIPRPDTELLVDIALGFLQKKLAQGQESFKVLDLGTGSGAIALAIASTIAKNAPHSQVWACDKSPAALALAQENMKDLGLKNVKLFESDWYSACESEVFDLIVSNPPYIRAHDEHLSLGDLRFEPQSALTDDGDGLSAYRVIISQAPNYLVNAGYIVLEHGYDQSKAVCALLESHGFRDIEVHHDLAGIARAASGRLG